MYADILDNCMATKLYGSRLRKDLIWVMLRCPQTFGHIAYMTLSSDIKTIWTITDFFFFYKCTFSFVPYFYTHQIGSYICRPKKTAMKIAYNAMHFCHSLTKVWSLLLQCQVKWILLNIFIIHSHRDPAL